VPPVQGGGRLSWWSAYRLNGIYLLSYLIQEGFSAELVNKYFREKDRFQNLLNESPRSVIISSTFVRNKAVLKRLVDDIRAAAPDVFIIAGGVFVYTSFLLMERSKNGRYETELAKDDYLFLREGDPSVDLYIISAQGEKILCDALKRLQGNQPMDGLRNAAYRQGKTHHFTGRIDDVSATDDLSFVSWPSLPETILDPGVVAMRASRGCPYNCAFCNFVKDRRLLYVKPADRLIQELRAVARRCVRYVWFVDDNFRLGKRELRELCQRLVEEALPIRWMTMIRAGALKGMDPLLLREAGCIEVQMGLESADTGILKNMNKGADPKLYREVVEGLLGAGINCSCYFMFGFPGETEESALRTRRFIQDLEHPELEGTLSWTLFPFSLAPLSPIYEPEMRERFGLTGYMDRWKHATMDSDRAKEHVKESFMELDHSCAIYRGDNLDILRRFSPVQQKRFLVVRHRLSKRTLEGSLTNEEVISAFGEILGFSRDPSVHGGEPQNDR
jgi:p-methyltransferase